jgi:hypothetical protein
MCFKYALSLAISSAVLAACGTTSAGPSTDPSTESSTTKAATDPGSGVKQKSLEAGDYVVTFAGTLPCQAHEMNLKKAYKAAAEADQLPEVDVSQVGPVGDNLMHPMFCLQTPPLSQGTILIKLPAKSTVAAAPNSSLSIVAISQVTASESVVLGSENQAYGAGDYTAELQVDGSCRPQEINLTKSLVYTTGQPLAIELSPNGPVPDTKAQPLFCAPEAKDFGVAYLKLTAPSAVKAKSSDASTPAITALTRITQLTTIGLD